MALQARLQKLLGCVSLSRCERRRRSLGVALLSVLTILVLAPRYTLAAEPSVGVVTKVENEAEIVSSGGASAANVGSVLRMKDELRTGQHARLQVTFRDNSSLTLGENATVVIDKYVFDPDAGIGETALNNTAGALRFATGRIKSLSNKNVTVTTPVAQLGVRGTDLWTGLLNLVQGVYAIEPVVEVSNQAGAVTLAQKGQGTYIASATSAPSQPSFWSAAEIAEALNQTSFGNGGGQQQENRSRPDRRGENRQQPPQQDQQYVVNGGPGSFIAAVAGAAIFAATMSSQSNDGRANRVNQPASP